MKLKSNYYKEEFGSFYLYDPNDNLVLMTDQISMVYDAESGTMFKHGPLEAAEAYFTKAVKTFPMTQIVTFTKDFPLEEINKCLASSTYLPFMLEKYRSI